VKAACSQNRAWLLSVAKAVASRLQRESVGTPIRIRVPTRAGTTNTDGWSAVIGSLGRGKPRLEIWLDRFSGGSKRKLYACFRSEKRPPLLAISKKVGKKLWPVRIVTVDDTDDEKYLRLSKPLTRSEFNAPLLEKYSDGRTFYGIYDLTQGTTQRVSSRFCTRAAAFFEDVARSLPQSKIADENRDIYPQIENRKIVASHLQRERSKLLAAECKIRDGYRCRVCGFKFETGYGELGRDFAEAHHLIPLALLRGSVRTQLDDLVTVCANCHRMLHRMEGKKRDVERLRKIVRRKK